MNKFLLIVGITFVILSCGKQVVSVQPASATGPLKYTDRFCTNANGSKDPAHAICLAQSNDPGKIYAKVANRYIEVTDIRLNKGMEVFTFDASPFIDDASIQVHGALTDGAGNFIPADDKAGNPGIEALLYYSTTEKGVKQVQEGNTVKQVEADIKVPKTAALYFSAVK